MSVPHLPPVDPAMLSDATTPSQETTVSALTTDTNFVDLSVDSGGGEDSELPPLTRIFHCPFIEESANSQNGKVSWFMFMQVVW